MSQDLDVDASPGCRHKKANDGTNGQRSNTYKVLKKPRVCTKGRDFYKILNVEYDSGSEAIRKAYRRRALECHPDRAGDSEQSRRDFLEIQRAYEVLSDPRKRRIFDEHGEAGIHVINSASYLGFVLEKWFSTVVFIFSVCCLILEFNLLLFVIFITLKIDNITGISWPGVFAPLFVLDSLVFLPYYFTCTRNVGERDASKKEGTEPSLVVEKGILPRLRITMYILLVIFQILVSLKLSKSLDDTWLATFIPAIAFSMINIAVSFAGAVGTVGKGVYVRKHVKRDPDDSGFQVKDETVTQRPYTTSEKSIILFGCSSSLTIAVQVVLLAFKMSNLLPSVAWKYILLPAWIWLGIMLTTIILTSTKQALFSPKNTPITEDSSQPGVFLLVVVPKIILFILGFAFTCPTILLITKRLSTGDPSARYVSIPVYVFMGLVMIMTLLIPALSVISKRILLEVFEAQIAESSHDNYQVAGLLESNNTP